MEEDLDQDKPNHNEFNPPAEPNTPHESNPHAAVEETTDVETTNDPSNAENNDDKISGVNSVQNQPETVAIGSNEDVIVEKEVENGSFRSPNVSPSRTGSGSGNGGEKEDKAREEEAVQVLVPKMESEAFLVETEQQVLEEVDEEGIKNNVEYHKSFLLEPDAAIEDESGTEDDQAAFMKELETFHKERHLEFKPPKFYGEPLNCLKLWRSVIRLGGYEQVTSCKFWRQVGESFKPPKTCTTVSWTFRCFYEKALLEYEKYKSSIGELPFTDVSSAGPASGAKQISINQTPGSGRARRDAAARAMQGWHSQRLGNGEIGEPVIKDKTSSTTVKREKQSIGLLKRKKPSSVERAVKIARMKASKSQLDSAVVDIGPPAEWVKINVQRTKDCFEVYALVPGLLREEVRVQSDPAGRLVISGQPEQLDNPWGISPFKKVVSLPSRIDPHQTSAVVTLHGQLFVRVPFEQPAM